MTVRVLLALLIVGAVLAAAALLAHHLGPAAAGLLTY